MVLRGCTQKLLRWPILVVVFSILGLEFVLYLLVRAAVAWYELPARWRHRREKRALAEAQDFVQWCAAARELDRKEGRDEWKRVDESPFFDFPLIRTHIANLASLRSSGDFDGLMALLKLIFQTYNVGGINNHQLYNETHFGTKALVNDFIQAVLEASIVVRDAEELTLHQRREFFKRARRWYGRTALMLSGGAAMGYYHCLREGTPVALADGTIIPAQTVKRGDLLLSAGGAVPVKTVQLDLPRADLYRIATAIGSFDVTGNHQLTLSWRTNPQLLLTPIHAAEDPRTHWMVAQWWEYSDLEGFHIVSRRWGVRLLAATPTAPAAQVDLLATVQLGVDEETDDDQEDSAWDSSTEASQKEREEGDEKECKFDDAASKKPTLSSMRERGCAGDKPTVEFEGTREQLVEFGQAQVRLLRAWVCEQGDEVLFRGAVLDVPVSTLLAHWSQLATKHETHIASIIIPRPALVEGAEGLTFNPATRQAASSSTLLALGRGRYRVIDLAVERASVQIAYQMFNPPRLDGSQPHTRGQVTHLNLERVHEFLGVEVTRETGLLTTELCPASSADDMRPLQFQEACRSNMAAMLLLDLPRLVVFGRITRQCWLRHASSLQDEAAGLRVTNMFESSQLGVPTLEVRFRVATAERQCTVFFAPHPSAARHARALTFAVGLAHGLGHSELIAKCADVTWNLAQFVDRPVAVGGKKQRIVNIVVDRPKPEQQRYVVVPSGVGDGLLTHNSGVLKTLIEAKCMPQIISGASAGSLMSAFIACRTDAEVLRDLCMPEGHQYFRACEEPFRVKAARWWKHGHYFDKDQWREHMRRGVTKGDTTFLEAYQQYGRIINIAVTASSKYAPTLILNYRSTPDVVIWSAVLASSAFPNFLAPVELQAKNPRTGRLEAFHVHGASFTDGTIKNDIPQKEMRRMWNANYFIVSQVNPHVMPLFYGQRGGVGRPAASLTQTPSSGLRGGFILSTLEKLLKLEVKKWFKLVADLDLLPLVFGADWRFIYLQKLTGTVTIVPDAPLSAFWHIISDPTRERWAHYLLAGEKATWYKLCRISNHYRIEKMLIECTRVLDDRARKAGLPVSRERLSHVNAGVIVHQSANGDRTGEQQSATNAAADADEGTSASPPTATTAAISSRPTRTGRAKRHAASKKLHVNFTSLESSPETAQEQQRAFFHLQGSPVSSPTLRPVGKASSSGDDLDAEADAYPDPSVVPSSEIPYTATAELLTQPDPPTWKRGAETDTDITDDDDERLA